MICEKQKQPEFEISFLKPDSNIENFCYNKNAIASSKKTKEFYQVLYHF